jgi:hypothetical protein
MRWGEAASAVLRPLAFRSFERIGLSVQEF